MDKLVDEERTYLTLDEVHEELLNLLLRFDAFCKEHNLRYSLDSGTLLGAVRHKGFIPWDDDIDLNMPRPDYDKLLKVANHLPTDLCVINASNSNFTGGFTKLCTSNIRAQEPSYDGVMEEMLWIDIFPTDGVPENPEQFRKSKKRIQRALKRNEWANINHNYERGARKVIKTFFGWLFRFQNPKRRLLKLIEETIECPGYESAKQVGCFFGAENGLWTLPKSAYEKTVYLEFEGHMLPCMSCWDEFLTDLYGDYMKLPSENERQTHCLKAWRA